MSNICLWLNRRERFTVIGYGPTTEPVWTVYGIEYAQSAWTWNFLSRQHPAGKVCDRERHVLWVSCSLNEGIQPHGCWEISLLPSDWPVFGRAGRSHVTESSRALDNGTPTHSGARERESGLDENQKKPLPHTGCVLLPIHWTPSRATLSFN